MSGKKSYVIKVEHYLFEKVKKGDLPVNIPLEPIYFEEYNRRRIVGLFPQFIEGETNPYELKIVSITDKEILTTYLRTGIENISNTISMLGNDNKTQEELLRDKVVRYLMNFFEENMVAEGEFKQKYYTLTESILKFTNLKNLSFTPDQAIEAAVMDKQKIIDQCRAAGACKTEFNLLVSATTDKEFLSVLARNIDWCNDNIELPTDVLKLFSKDEDAYVRGGVARNENAPKDVLTLLSKDKDAYVRGGVAWNENAPKDALILLSKDEDAYVRLGVAWNKNTPKDVLTLLSKDESNFVRVGVSQNPNFHL